MSDAWTGAGEDAERAEGWRLLALVKKSREPEPRMYIWDFPPSDKELVRDAITGAGDE